MSFIEQKEIMVDFNKVISELQTAKEPLSAAEQHSYATRLSEAYNFISAQTAKPSLLNVIRSKSAHDERIKNQLEEERKTLEIHRKFIESTVKDADHYFRVIQLGGYAVFFAVWGFTRDWLSPRVEILSALLMTLSASIFVGWEIYKSTLLALSLKSHASLGESSLEKFIQNRFPALKRQGSHIFWQVRFRSWVWLMSVFPAVIAVALLVTQFFIELVR
jgi:hypothetical protein